MAGIGFELVKRLKEGSYLGLVRAYGLTALIGSGPGLLIIFGLGLVCFFSLFATPSANTVREFLTIVIYLFSGSMLASAGLQYTFVRFVADKVFLKEFDTITPNFIGVLFLQFMLSLSIALPVVVYFFSHYSWLLKTLLVSNFILLSLSWIATVLLTGLKSYRRILWAFVFGYSLMIIVHFIFEQRQNELIFLLLEFLLAQFVLLVLLLHTILDFYPTNELIQFEFLDKKNFYYSLVFANFFYTLGFWIDKYLFWFNQDTSYSTFPPLRASAVYDFPMFIAFMSIIPASAVFMLQMESKFSLIYPQVMEAIFKRKNLAEIDLICNQLVLAGRQALYSLLKTQACVIIILFLLSSWMFETYHLLPVSWNLLFVLIIGAGLNAILWALLSILYYMTKYLQALYISLVFVVSNGIFTQLSLYAGPWYFGYGYCFSLLLSIAFALALLNKDFKDIGYSTFMMVA